MHLPSLSLALLALLGLAAGQATLPPATQAPAADPPVAGPASSDGEALAPLAAALASDYSTFWTVVKAARLEKLFDDRTAELTVLVPNNEAWVARLPSLTAGFNLTAAQLLSDGKARVLEQVLNYHVLPGRPVETLDALALRGRLSTNANSCSTSKNVQIAATRPTGEVTLASSLGGTARTVSKPTKLAGGSVIFPIDDVLIPSTVTIPIDAALAGPGALETSAVDRATLDGLAAAIKGKEPLPLTDDTGLEARDKATLGANSRPVGGPNGIAEEVQPAEAGPAPARRRVAIPTLPAEGGAAAAPTSPPAVASMDGEPAAVMP